MPGLVVVGLQWGDEGKGKIVDWLAARADMVVRFQGGHNAGHTLVIDGVTYKLNLLPSGIVRGVPSIIGPGVVVDPWKLLDEIDKIKPPADALLLAENACLVLPWHHDLDSAREDNASEGGKIGTTKRGIGPAYEDKVGRRSIRVADLADPDALDARLERLLAHHRPLRAGLNLPPPDAAALKTDLLAIAERLLSLSGPTWPHLAKASASEQNILFEGAQGVMLDVDHGTWPFVTSSNTCSGQAACGSGIGPDAITSVLGVVKTYATRVGLGPFPTELSGEDGQKLGERGGEVGTVTGRARRCGWFDAALTRQACVLSGVDSLVLTKLDVLDGFETLRICTGYRLDGNLLAHLPASSALQARLEPVYEDMPGWDTPTRGIREESELPEAARAYILRLEELLGRPVSLLSTSPEREDIIVRADIF